MDQTPSAPRPLSAPRYALTLLAVLLAWTGLYVSIQPLAAWLTFDLLSLAPGGAPGLALEFFLYDSAKILLLLVLMVYCIGWLRAGLHVERVRDYLSGKGRGIGYLLGAMFGAITPFCSCSSIPLFLGFTMARIPLGITMAFLITSPLINEIAVVLLWGLLGWKFTVVYVVVGMAAGCIPVVGYNMGAGKKTRVRELFTKLLLCEAIVGAVALVLAEGFPRQLIAVFGAANESSYYTDFAIKAFRTYLCMMVLACVNKACFIFLQAVGKAFSSTMLSMVREVVFGVGFALLLPRFFGLDGVLYSMPVSDVLTFVIAAGMIVKTYRELNTEGATVL